MINQQQVDPDELPSVQPMRPDPGTTQYGDRRSSVGDHLAAEIHWLEVKLDIGDARRRHLRWILLGFPPPWRQVTR